MQFIEKYSDIDWDAIYEHNVLIVPVLSDHEKHRCENRLSFIYFYDFDSDSEFIIGCNHNDLEKNGCDWVNEIKWPETIFCYNNAILDQYGIHCWDIDLCYWLQFNAPLDIELSEDITSYYRWYRTLNNVNDIVPVVSFVEYCQNIVENFKECIYTIEFGKTLSFYNDVVLKNFHTIESMGIPVDNKIVKKFFNKDADILYSQYYPYTSTGRPSNRFGGINFAALDKTTGVREMIKVTDRNQFLVEFDYDSHHVRLVAKIIGYDLPDGNLHEYFGRQYFNTPILTPEQYAESKTITFRMLYGNLYNEYREIKFFKMVHEYRQTMWKQFTKMGYVESPMTKRKLIRANFDDMSSNKLFNYILQGYETDVNNIMLSKILKYLYKKHSKLILYTYDSFLFVYDMQDGKEFITDISAILNDYGMRTSLKVGKNYNDVKRPKI
jgi:hypothetical protein